MPRRYGVDIRRSLPVCSSVRCRRADGIQIAPTGYYDVESDDVIVNVYGAGDDGDSRSVDIDRPYERQSFSSSDLQCVFPFSDWSESERAVAAMLDEAVSREATL